MFLVKWRMFNTCNFNCSYCINKSLNKLAPMQNDIIIPRLINYAKNIKRLIENEPSTEYYKLLLIGGEITILPEEDLINILNTLYSKKLRSLIVTSNFSAPFKYYVKIQEWCTEHDVTFHLTVSLHEEFFIVDRFLEKAKEIKDIIDDFNIEQVVTKKNKEIVEKVKEYCEENNIVIAFDFDRNEQWEADEVIRKRDILRNTINPYGYTCSNSKFQINIMPEGTVYGVNCKGRKLMGLINMLPKLIREEIICDQTKCSFCGKIRIYDKEGNQVFSSVDDDWEHNW